VEAVRERLLAKDARLLTLTGTGGIGKTRLALAAAAGLLEGLADEVRFVDLAPIADASLVEVAIAQALGVVESHGEPLECAMEEHLRDRRLLLVLDNFEQVLAAAPLVDRLLGACPALRVLVTSRAPLGLRRERTFRVPPLALPDSVQAADVLSVQASEAVALFTQRARAAKHDFRLTEANASVVAEICARLDGLPLAIELAAARVTLLPPAVLLRRLGSRLGVLTRGARDAPARHQTLRATIDWSHELLKKDEQALFRRLATFVGGCSVEAAEEVCRLEDDPVVDPLGALESLVNWNLLRQSEGAGGVESRVSMLETLHEYARERLAESGEGTVLRRRHAQFFVRLAEEAGRNLRGPTTGAWLDRLEHEHDNLRAALEWARHVGDDADAEVGLRLGASLTPFWLTRGYLSEGRRRLDGALDASRATGGAERAAALRAAGSIAVHQGEYERAQAHQEEGFALSERLGDRRGVAQALNNLGHIEWLRGRPEQAVALLGKSEALHREMGHPYTEAVLHNLGMVAHERGDHVRAWELLEESLALNRALGNGRGIARALHSLMLVALVRGEPERAASLSAESLTLKRDLGDKQGIAQSLEALAGVVAVQERPTRAAQMLGAAEALREEIGTPLALVERPAIDRHVAEVRRRLDEATFAAMWAEGRAMTREVVVELALAAPPAAASKPSPPPAGPLTPREREVVMLLARGLSDREIGEELQIEKSTASAHVHNILRKLELRSRGQVTAWVVEGGLLPAARP